jgi:hypothetical protein
LSVKPKLRQDGTTRVPVKCRLLRHPLFAWLGVRPIEGQHTVGEHEALKKWAAGRLSLIEIGVAEGASAVALRESMSASGTLWLIDPFHLSRLRCLNATKRAARRVVAGSSNGRVVWIEKFSTAAANEWSGPIDFLFIDGDHSEEAVQRDWDNWHKFVTPGGVVVFHDAARFPGGWTRDDWGPVRLVNRLFRDKGIPGWAIVEEVDSLVVIQRVVGPRAPG